MFIGRKEQSPKGETSGFDIIRKLTFDGCTYRTPRVNEAARLIHNLDAGFKGMKNGKNHLKNDLSRWVVPIGRLINLVLN
jgi:hypothetical protein